MASPAWCRFSKKIENHRAAIALHMAYFTYVAFTRGWRMTPAMALGVTDHIWTIGQLVEAALAAPKPTPLVPPALRSSA